MIYGVSFDDQEANARFAEKYHFNFPLLCDTTRAMGLAYGAADAPDQGTARRAGGIIDPEGRIFAWFPKVSAKDFPNEALALLP